MPNVILQPCANKGSRKHYQDTIENGFLLNDVSQFLSKSEIETLKNIEALEIIAKLAFLSQSINPKSKINDFLINKHFDRKHGVKSYYGQK